MNPKNKQSGHPGLIKVLKQFLVLLFWIVKLLVAYIRLLPRVKRFNKAWEAKVQMQLDRNMNIPPLPAGQIKTQPKRKRHYKANALAGSYFKN